MTAILQNAYSIYTGMAYDSKEATISIYIYIYISNLACETVQYTISKNQICFVVTPYYY
jgi:hypothetical protein